MRWRMHLRFTPSLKPTVFQNSVLIPSLLKDFNSSPWETLLVERFSRSIIVVNGRENFKSRNFIYYLHPLWDDGFMSD